MKGRIILVLLLAAVGLVLFSSVPTRNSTAVLPGNCISAEELYTKFWAGESPDSEWPDKAPTVEEYASVRCNLEIIIEEALNGQATAADVITVQVEYLSAYEQMRTIFPSSAYPQMFLPSITEVESWLDMVGQANEVPEEIDVRAETDENNHTNYFVRTGNFSGLLESSGRFVQLFYDFVVVRDCSESMQDEINLTKIWDCPISDVLQMEIAPDGTRMVSKVDFNRFALIIWEPAE